MYSGYSGNVGALAPIRSAKARPSRGAQGHTPPENFLNSSTPRRNLVHFGHLNLANAQIPY